MDTLKRAALNGLWAEALEKGKLIKDFYGEQGGAFQPQYHLTQNRLMALIIDQKSTSSRTRVDWWDNRSPPI